jgi:hypothetical protein
MGPAASPPKDPVLVKRPIAGQEFYAFDSPTGFAEYANLLRD